MLLEKLMQEMRDLLQKLADYRELKAEERTEEKKTEKETLLVRAKELEKEISQEKEVMALEERMSESVKPPIVPDPVDPPPGEGRSGVEVGKDREGIRPFESFGEQLRCVYAACRADSPVIDKRLLEIRAASGMSEGVLSDGGYLVQQDFTTELLKRTYETGVLAPKCRKIPIAQNSNGLKVNALDETSRVNGSRWGGIQAYWEGEADAYTGSKPKFRQMELNLRKLIGLCYSTDELLKDTSALGAVIADGFAEEFGFKIDDAIVHGTGAGMPLGLLNGPDLVSQSIETGQKAASILGKNVLNMWSRLWARSRANANWFINQDLEPQLSQMSIPVGTAGIPVYMPANGLSGSPYATLFGRPVIPIEQCQTIGTVGDIILTDLSQYLLIDKGSMNSASSIHVRFLYDEEIFKFTYRVDGQPIWNSPLTPYKGSNTQSPTVVLAVRA